MTTITTSSGVHLKFSHELLMMRSIQLAEKGRGSVEPNPLVGACVIDKNGTVISQGWHARFGGEHAEVRALKPFLKKPASFLKDKTLVISLEPCSTQGKTSACTDLILKSGIQNVIVGSLDPNPKHRGRGIHILRKQGICVQTGFLSDCVAKQNEKFFKFMKNGSPFITLKLAQSLDGKIATRLGESKWITGPLARKQVQNLRQEHDAILVGTNTLKLDKPSLQVRGKKKGRHPRRIFIARKPGELKSYLKTHAGQGDVLYHAGKLNFDLKNVEVVQVPFTKEGIALKFLVNSLARLGITSLLVEGGGEMAASFLKAKLVDKVVFFVAPLIIGGRQAPTGVEGVGIARLTQALSLSNVQVTRVGEDVMITADVNGKAKGK